jgi:hypothetical protein
MEQTDPQPGFQRFDSVAYRARGDPKLLGGQLETLLASRRLKQSKQRKGRQSRRHLIWFLNLKVGLSAHRPASITTARAEIFKSKLAQRHEGETMMRARPFFDRKF